MNIFMVSVKNPKDIIMWICPKCHHKFYNTNQSHSCGDHTIQSFLENKSITAVELFYIFIKEYEQIGKFDLHPVKTRVALLTQMRFASINKLYSDSISIHLVLTESYPQNNCFYKIENLADRFFLHHLRLFRKEDMNDEVRYYMKLAYETGNRKHVKKKSS